MKYLFAVLLGFGLISCSQKKDGNSQENKIENEKISEKGQMEKSGNDSVRRSEESASTEEGRLTCKDLGEDEFGFPSSEVFVSVDSELKKIAKCIVCQEFDEEEFEQFHVPESTISVTGGWYAGGGDYYYSILNLDGDIEVYEGWIDEGQDDLGENPYHWKRIDVIDSK